MKFQLYFVSNPLKLGSNPTRWQSDMGSGKTAKPLSEHDGCVTSVCGIILVREVSILSSRRDDRVDEGDGLENRCGLTVTVGSNPTLSAFPVKLLLILRDNTAKNI
jgi:hypothetical protein